jgi:hypothetical protein
MSRNAQCCAEPEQHDVDDAELNDGDDRFEMNRSKSRRAAEDGIHSR